MEVSLSTGFGVSQLLWISLKIWNLRASKMRAVIGIWLGLLGKAVRTAAFLLFLPCMRWMTTVLCNWPGCKSSEAMGWNWTLHSYPWQAFPFPQKYWETEKEAKIAMQKIYSSKASSWGMRWKACTLWMQATALSALNSLKVKLVLSSRSMGVYPCLELSPCSGTSLKPPAPAGI